jgi:CheY-like chemotaxis protein
MPLPVTRSLPVPEPARRLRVMIADADPDNRLLYREALRSLPLDIVEAGDGRDALVTCAIDCPALLITDAHLPEIDGLALSAALKRDPMTRSIHVLVVISEPGPAELARARQAEAAVLAAPVSPEELAAAVARLCDTGAPSEPHESASSRPASRTFRRFDTTSPQQPPPVLHCMKCTRPLLYRKSRVGGVTERHAEQWDELECPDCAERFEYRHRTKRLRPVTP